MSFLAYSLKAALEEEEDEDGINFDQLKRKEKKKKKKSMSLINYYLRFVIIHSIDLHDDPPTFSSLQITSTSFSYRDNCFEGSFPKYSFS